MLQLVPPDTHYLFSAIGWLELGNPAEARLDLEKLSSEVRTHPDVLEIEWIIVAEEKNWNAALVVARNIVQRSPDRASGWLHQAYALRRATDGGLLSAWNALLPVAEKFPEEPTVFYNLACYACQLQREDHAFPLLKRAMEIGDKKTLQKMALADSDLEPLWEEIKKL